MIKWGIYLDSDSCPFREKVKNKGGTRVLLICNKKPGKADSVPLCTCDACPIFSKMGV
jgi:uncharacterized protein YaiI (UPF0178 family)